MNRKSNCRVECRVRIGEDDTSPDIELKFAIDENDVFPSTRAAAAFIRKMQDSRIIDTNACIVTWYITPAESGDAV